MNAEDLREFTVIMRDAESLVSPKVLLKEFRTTSGLLLKLHPRVLAIIPWRNGGGCYSGQFWMLWPNNRLAKESKQICRGLWPSGKSVFDNSG